MLTCKVNRDMQTLAILLVTISISASFVASCGVSSLSRQDSRSSHHAGAKPKETPVPLQQTEANQGKRCEPRIYTNVGKDVDYNPYCYQVEYKLVKASLEGNLSEMREALKEGASANGAVYEFYSTPLHMAADSGKSEAVSLLIDNGAKVNQGNFIIGTPLIAAAGNGHAEVVKLLLESGADPCFKADGGTARDFAQRRGHQEIVEIIKTFTSADCK
jgi:hypothetical protein